MRRRHGSPTRGDGTGCTIWSNDISIGRGLAARHHRNAVHIQERKTVQGRCSTRHSVLVHSFYQVVIAGAYTETDAWAAVHRVAFAIHARCKVTACNQAEETHNMLLLRRWLPGSLISPCTMWSEARRLAFPLICLNATPTIRHASFRATHCVW